MLLLVVASVSGNAVPAGLAAVGAVGCTSGGGAALASMRSARSGQARAVSFRIPSASIAN